MAAQAQTTTRKQLDELDALLQKMLGQPAPPAEVPSPRSPTTANYELPSDQPKPPQFPPPAVAYGVPPAVAFAASSPTTAQNQETDERPGWSIDLNPKEGSSVLGAIRTAANNATLPPSPTERPSPTGLLSVTTIPHPVPAPITKSTSFGIAESWYELPLLLRPVAWFSNRCDATLRACGPIGRMFTSPAGRTLMGYVGLAMLAASIASGALAWIGWSW